jgi:hypothetical protein
VRLHFGYHVCFLLFQVDPDDVWLVDEFDESSSYLPFEDGNFNLKKRGVHAGSYLLVETSERPGELVLNQHFK